MNNKIYNMDCLLDIKDISDNYINLVIIDSPYDICTKGGKKGNTKIDSSIEFDVKKHRFLWIRQYYGNKEIYLDLSKIDKDMMEQLFIEEEKVNNNEYDMNQGWWCNMKKRIIKF